MAGLKQFANGNTLYLARDALATTGQLTFPLALVFDADGHLERVVTDVGAVKP